MADTQSQNLTERVSKLRKQSLDAVESLSSERAELLTDFYQKKLAITSVPVQRAMSFAWLLAHKRIAIYDGELIVGEKGDSPKAAPSFPELCCHTLEDLDILNTRSLTSFKVSPATRKAYQEKVIPFWQGKSIRDLLFAEMTPEWKDAYDAGIFTEFMEQRAPGHTVLDDKIYHHGMLDFQQKIDTSLAKLDYLNDPEAYDKQEELKAMHITAGALIRFAERYSTLALELAHQESDPVRKSELEKIAEVCAHIPAHAPRNLHEALQYYWFVHLGVTTELNTWDSYCPGRLDQHLLHFYEKGLADGTLTRDTAKELLCCFWIKFNNQPAPPKVGVTAAESGTYTDFAQINVGGLRADGSDGVNEVSYLLLEVIEEMRLLQPSSSIQVSKKNPDRFIKRAAKIIRTGFGQPSIFNADLIAQELMRAGKTLVDARCGGSSGCVEVGAFGKENYNLTGYFNLPKVLELTLHNGLDPRTGKQLGPQTGEAAQFTDFDQLFDAFEKQMLYFVELKVRGNQVIERLYANYMPAPFLSLLTDDCISSGKDYHNGGARYNTSYIQGVGIGSIADALAAIKTHVYEQPTFKMDDLLMMLDANFEGHERARQLLLNRTPKYGNDDDAADALMVRVFESYFNAVDGRRNTKGGEYHINMLPTTCHIYFGSVTGALPDGRFAGKPLSEGVSPVQGADQHGPTAVARSVAKMDQVRTGGTLLNQKFTPQVLDSEEGLNGLVQLVRGYFNLDGHHIQFNVVDAETLKAAQANPEQYRSLIVRVAGYSDYFCDLSKQLQDEIITRTAYDGF
jgi:formate C-acetyltransferase